MKNIFLSLIIISFASLTAQPDDEIKWMFGVHGGFNQYRGDMGNGWYATNQAAYSFGGASFTYFLNRHFDLTLFGTRGDVGYQLPWNEEIVGQRNGFLVRKTTIDLLAKYYFIGREPFFQPYVFAGGGILMQGGQGDNSNPAQRRFDASLPSAGFGFNIRFAPFLLLQIQETFSRTNADYVDYRVAGGNDMYLMHSIGLLFSIPKPSVKRNGPDLVVDKCPKLPKELEAKKQAKKRSKAKERAEKKRRK